MAQFRLPMHIIIYVVSRYYIMSSGALSVLNTKTLAIIHSETTAAQRLDRKTTVGIISSSTGKFD